MLNEGGIIIPVIKPDREDNIRIGKIGPLKKSVMKGREKVRMAKEASNREIWCLDFNGIKGFNAPKAKKNINRPDTTPISFKTFPDLFWSAKKRCIWLIIEINPVKNRIHEISLV